MGFPQIPTIDLSSAVKDKAALIWAIADKLTGVYQPHEYGDVIIPLTVIRRFDCALADSRQAVWDIMDSVKDYPESLRDGKLKKESDHEFYNTSPFNFENLLDDPAGIEENLIAYLQGFSPNVRDIIERFEFNREIKKMASKNILYIVLKEFTSPRANLHPSVVSNLEMGYIFEEIIRKFAEAHNASAGQHYTPREVIELMVNILFEEDIQALSNKAITKTIFDPACGTGGMLSEAESHLHGINPKAKLLSHGQEINDNTFAICKADMLIKGNHADNIRCGNSLSDDLFTEGSYDYIISNPPFGREWKNEKTDVEKEAKLGEKGRFAAGLPKISDGQMLFLQIALSKMKSIQNGGSRIAIIHNGSPLFTGDAESGPSEIRRYIIENDLLEAIIALPNDIFYNTGIATYLWVLSNKKSAARKGKVQLIDGNKLFEKRRKSLGSKRNDIPQSAIAELTRLYGAFEESPISKIFDNKEFGYAKITVERPLRDDAGELILKKGKKQPDAKLRDTENVPLSEDIQSYFKREVLPHVPDAWIDEKKTKIGYEIPFTRYFYQYAPPRPSSEIRDEILAIEKELEGALKDIFSV